jgi:4-hydroxybenzoate polyprenyltransferase
VRILTNKITGYVELLRPFTLVAPLLVSSCIMVASLAYNKTADFSLLVFLQTILPASICLALLNGASNALNQATDRKEDALSKPYRPIPQGIISPQEAYTVSFILYTAALLLSLAVNIMFSFFALLIACCSITYSLPPRTKKYLFVNQLWVALPRGFFGIVGSWAVFGNPLQPLPLAMGLIAALFLFGGTATKDMLDAGADRTVGTKTLINVFGVKTTTRISVFFMTVAFLLVLPFVYFHIINISLLPLIFLSILSIIIGWLMLHKHKNTKYENTSAWTLMYATYFIFALSFAAITISFSV